MRRARSHERTGVTRFARVALLLVALTPLAGCQTIAGYDGRAPREEAPGVSDVDAGDDPLADAAPNDAAADARDAAPAPATRNCAALGVTCAPGAPYCSIYFDAARHEHAYACTDASDEANAPSAEMTCGLPPLECADGLACGYAWHAGYRCAPVCTTARDCPSARPFCNHPLTLPANLPKLRICEACDPVAQGDCAPPNDACLARSVTTEPACGAVVTSAGGAGARCLHADECQRGLLCVCNGGQGVGDDCATASDGACRAPCHVYERGAACAGGAGTCAGIGAASLYSYCQP